MMVGIPALLGPIVVPWNGNSWLRGLAPVAASRIVVVALDLFAGRNADEPNLGETV